MAALLRLAIILLVGALAACASTGGEASGTGISTYGTVDVGISHTH